MRNNSNSNSLFNVSKGITCKELYNKECGDMKDISCLYLSFIRSTRQSIYHMTLHLNIFMFSITFCSLSIKSDYYIEIFH